VTGSFNTMKTRAFSPVTKRPFKPLAQLLDQQHIFDLGSTNGTMVGFYIPGYLSGLNIVGLHFHYLSADFKRGGHLLNLSAENAEVEIAELEGLHLTVPNSLDFQHYDFSQGNSKALEVIEKGKH
jgi:acetolactate decarboxylase